MSESKTREPVEDVDSDEEDNQKAEVVEPVVEEDTSLNNCEVITKYQEAAKIAQAVLLEVANLVRSMFFLHCGWFWSFKRNLIVCGWS